MSPYEEIEVLRLQIRRLTERSNAQFDLGYRACLRMAEAGAPIDRLREASGVPHLAFDNEPHVPTQPFHPFDDEITDVDAVIPGD